MTAEADAAIAKLEALRDDPNVQTTITAAMLSTPYARELSLAVHRLVMGANAEGAPFASCVVAIAAGLGYTIGASVPERDRGEDAVKIMTEIAVKVLEFAGPDAHRRRKETEHAGAGHSGPTPD